ncbi:hypothetical protein SSBG_05876 [Streptomyces sp. SPB074]|nr:hypothetical protein SSBG_05876 [Streptomyces sp. SPB074]
MVGVGGCGGGGGPRVSWWVASRTMWNEDPIRGRGRCGHRRDPRRRAGGAPGHAA